MAKIVYFSDDFYDMGAVKFESGKYYPLTSETQTLADSGFADVIDSENAANAAEVLQALADMARDRADAAMMQANALVKDAEDAQALADLARGAPPVAVQTPAQLAAVELRQTATALTDELRVSAEAFKLLDANAKAAPENVEMQRQVTEAHEAGLAISERCNAAVAAADAAEAALTAA